METLDKHIDAATLEQLLAERTDFRLIDIRTLGR